MFKENKYTKWYYSIVDKANSENRGIDIVSTHEVHHIIPKSLGGSNEPENLVKLTHKEHYILHLLLLKMLDGEPKYKMAWALSMLTGKDKIRSAREFEVARRKLSQASKGRPKSEEWKKKMSDIHRSKGNIFYGKSYAGTKHTEESKRKMSETKKLMYQNTPHPKLGKPNSPEAIAKMSATKKAQAARGELYSQSEEGRRRISEATIGRKHPHSSKVARSSKKSKTYLVQTPTGEILIVKNITAYGNLNGFSYANLVTYKKSKGYKLLSEDVSDGDFQMYEFVDLTMK